MIIYYPDPQDLINNTEFQEVIQIKLSSGGHINAEPITYNQMRVINVVSTDPMDFLDVNHQPGQIINL